MKLPRQQFLHLVARAAALTLISVIPLALDGHGAWSQTTTIKVLVPFPPGGSADSLLVAHRRRSKADDGGEYTVTIAAIVLPFPMRRPKIRPVLPELHLKPIAYRGTPNDSMATLSIFDNSLNWFLPTTRRLGRGAFL